MGNRGNSPQLQTTIVCQLTKLVSTVSLQANGLSEAKHANKVTEYPKQGHIYWVV